MGLCFRARPFIFLASKLSSFVATVTTRASEYRISWKGELSSLWQELPVPLACWSPIAHTMRNGKQAGKVKTEFGAQPCQSPMA